MSKSDSRGQARWDVTTTRAEWHAAALLLCRGARFPIALTCRISISFATRLHHIRAALSRAALYTERSHNPAR
jgi:hypothetical protein